MHAHESTWLLGIIRPLPLALRVHPKKWRYYLLASFSFLFFFFCTCYSSVIRNRAVLDLLLTFYMFGSLAQQALQAGFRH